MFEYIVILQIQYTKKVIIVSIMTETCSTLHSVYWTKFPALPGPRSINGLEHSQRCLCISHLSLSMSCMYVCMSACLCVCGCNYFGLEVTRSRSRASDGPIGVCPRNYRQSVCQAAANATRNVWHTHARSHLRVRTQRRRTREPAARQKVINFN